MQTTYDVIILGGSYAGLSAAMSLGRAIKTVLVIDNGKPCNQQTPYSHNFLSRDGQAPQEISEISKAQVAKYGSVNFVDDTAVHAQKTDDGLIIETKNGKKFQGKKLIIASGVKDEIPNIEGFAECWGITVIHCPYCHGYEVRNQKTGIFANGETAYEFSKLIWNWSKALTIFTNGQSTLTADQTSELKAKGILIDEREIIKIAHQNGKLQELQFSHGSTLQLDALYAKISFTQNSTIAEQLGCEMTAHGHILVDNMQKKTVDHVFACGDSTTMMRSVANAVHGGNLAGAIVSRELIGKEFNS